jgi:membrane-associated phospholipid phosphatase
VDKNMREQFIARVTIALLVPALAVAGAVAPSRARAQDTGTSASANPVSQSSGDTTTTASGPSAAPDASATPPEDPAPAPTSSSHGTPIGDFAGVLVGGGVGALALGLGIYFIPGPRPASTTAVWRGGFLLDNSVRSALEASTPAGENMAATASDILLVATMAHSALWDGIGLPLLHGDPELAWQAGFAYSLAVGLELSLGGIVKDVAMRARPYESECAANPGLPQCQSSSTYQSFFSLHSGVAFTSAGFSCSMHLERGLYGDQGADIVSCGSSIAAATLVGMLRVVADAHYLSDVLVGAVTGFLLGYLIPMAVIPHRHAAPPPADELDPDAEPIASTPSLSWSVAPMIDPGLGGNGTMLGASISGTF